MIDKSIDDGRRGRHLLLSLGLLAIVLTTITSALAQNALIESSGHNQKIDEYGDLNTDDEAARLDELVALLSGDHNARGCILSYSSPRDVRGPYLRRIYGIVRYLTEARGIEANRILLIDGGYKESSATELWLVSAEDAPTPRPSRAPPQINFSVPYKFDEECLECGPAVALYLYGLDEGLRFYAEVLRENPTSRALIIVRPVTGDLNGRHVVTEAKQAKGRLVNKHGIEASRITIRLRHPRADNLAVAEMWIMPRAK